MAGYFPSPQKKYTLGVITTDACYSCPCFCGFSYIEAAGGDEGFNTVFGVLTEGNTNATFTIDGYRYETIPDRIRVSANFVTVYDSLCGTGSFNSGAVSIPAGTTTIQIEVFPGCDGRTGTLWDFTFLITCA
jgi:hypothetical protein